MTAAQLLDSPASKEPLCECGEPLGPRLDGKRHTINGKEVCDDCYFDSFGQLADEYGVGRLVGRSRATCI